MTSENDKRFATLQRELDCQREQLAKNTKLAAELTTRGVLIPATELAPIERLSRGENLTVRLTEALVERDRSRQDN